uniref:Uncharacterized protein n=1 Tax=Anguilla anguilla TaxID=7936 RepID=A0A0E9S5M8_ANGAN
MYFSFPSVLEEEKRLSFPQPRSWALGCSVRRLLKARAVKCISDLEKKKGSLYINEKATPTAITPSSSLSVNTSTRLTRF